MIPSCKVLRPQHHSVFPNYKFVQNNIENKKQSQEDIVNLWVASLLLLCSDIPTNLCTLSVAYFIPHILVPNPNLTTWLFHLSRVVILETAYSSPNDMLLYKYTSVYYIFYTQWHIVFVLLLYQFQFVFKSLNFIFLLLQVNKHL